MTEAAERNGELRQHLPARDCGREVPWSRGLLTLPRASPLGTRVMLASLTINLLSLGLPIAILQVYDRILPNEATQTLLLLVLGLVAVLLIDALLRQARSYVTGWSAARFEHISSCRAVDRLLALSIGDFERDAPGVHLDRLNAIDSLREFNAGQAKLLMVDLPFVLIFVGLMWQIAGELALVPVVLLAVLAVVAGLIGRHLRTALGERAELDDRRYNFIIEVLNGIMTVKGLAMEPLIQRRYERLQETGAASTYRCILFSNLAQGVGSIFSSLAMVSVAVVGALQVIDGMLSIGALAACTLLSGRSIQPLLRALGLWAQFQGIRVARERLDRLFALKPETAERSIEAGVVAGAIEVSDVSFQYDPEAPMLKDLSLSVRPGETIAIAGGSGKTTLMMLIAGALVPDSGTIRIDGVDVGTLQPESLRRQIAYLPQTPVLFQGTILQNLTMFNDQVPIDDALDAARSLGLDALIHRLPAGYDTRVGDGTADELPTGMRQSIVIARALVGRPSIILFDEANSGLDSASDALLKEALAALKGGPTMIMISHRPSLVALADRRYELVEGRLVEQRLEPAGAPRPPEQPTAPEPPVHEPSRMTIAEQLDAAQAAASEAALAGTETGTVTGTAAARPGPAEPTQAAAS